MDKEWKILDKVYGILRDGNALNVPEDEPVIRYRDPEELQKIVDMDLPESCEPCVQTAEALCKEIVKYSVKTGHIHFHNQLFAGVDPFALAGSWIAEALNTSLYTFEVGPLFILMENKIIQHFSKEFGYPVGDGIFAAGGSSSNMYGMVLARYKAFPDVKTKGLFGMPQLVAFTSEDAHYSVKKAVHWLGIGTDNLEIVKTDEYGRMCPYDLQLKIDGTRAAKKVPFFVNATAGTTVLGAFDNLSAIADVCKKYNIWLHVDACLGGSVIMSKTHRHLLTGIENSDSISWNPHKTLGVPLQTSLFLTRHKGMLHLCNSASAQYLFQQDKFYDVSYDIGDKSIQCGRKIDVFKFWLMIKVRGLQGIGRLMDSAMDAARHLTQEIRQRDGFRLVIDTFQYTNVCFWYVLPKMRGLPETPEWKEILYKVPTIIKERMIKQGSLMVGFSPLPHKGKGNFFRMVFTCFPVATKQSISFVLDEIERLANNIEIQL